MRLLTLLIMLLLVQCAHAQDTGHPITTKYLPDSGVVVGNGKTFELNLRFRMQNRMAFITTAGDEVEIGSTDIRVRRMRLRLEGFVLSRKLEYKIQLGFSKADLDLVESTTPQPIRDAILTYKLTKHFKVGFGQDKLPGNRQRVVSSGSLQLPDRSIVNTRFTLDRDMGLFMEYKAGKVVLKGAMTSGEGRNANPGDAGLCYTGRAEWLPFGEFTKFGKERGDYFEGDLLREQKPRLSLAAGYSNNQNTRRNAGQLGEFLPGTERRTINTFIADLLFKYKGWAWSSEYCQREVVGEAVAVHDADAVTAMEGYGVNTQLSRMLGATSEVVGRYSLVQPTERVEASFARTEEGWLGYNRYINNHRVKLQAALNYAWKNGRADLDAAGNKWGLWLQVELGI